MERLIHLLIFPLVIASASAVEINLPASTEMLQSIDSVINEAVNKSKIPGGVIWLEREGNKYHKAYGHQSLIPVKRVMKNNSIFDAASLTKVMATAPSIMILVEQGRIALDDPVRKHLPEFIGGNKNKVTIKQLLTHTSGLLPVLPKKPAWHGYDKAIKLGIKNFVLSIDSSLAVEKYIIKHGGKVWRSKVGEANVIQMMIENDAEAGGEGSSGGFILKKFNMCRDGLLTSGLIASMINDESIQEDIEFFESFSQIRNKISIESTLHDKVIEKIAKKIGTEYKIDQLDGIRISINENTWSLIRKSNTEDIIRISTESNDSQLLQKIQKEMIKNVEWCYEEIK